MPGIAIVEYLAGARYNMLAFPVAVCYCVPARQVLGHHHAGAVADNAVILIYSHILLAILWTDVCPLKLVLYSFR